MVLKNFRLQVLVRSITLAVFLAGSAYFFLYDQPILTVLFLIIAGISVQSLIYYVESTNRKVTFFFESIENSDFTVKFSRDNKLGGAFKDLNAAFNRVFDAFREVRAEKEEHWNYLNTVVQYVRVGLLSFDKTGKIELFNNAAIKLLGTPYLQNIQQLKQYYPDLLNVLQEIGPGENALFQRSMENDELQLSITATELRLRGKSFKLVSLQDIQPELQQKEVESWQNLTKVLRHEIMNSITPITSNVETLNEMLAEELAEANDQPLSTETVQDISKALLTIEKRSKGLIHFVNAYRSYSSIPQPKVTHIKVTTLLERLDQLFRIEMQKASVAFEHTVYPKKLQLLADPELIETVLINLIKNALEACKGVSIPKVELTSGRDSNGRIYISVSDNGPGIISEAVDKIFVPFYTTKKQGSGIGLSLSRQIMHLHQGTLKVRSDTETKETVFVLKF